MPISTLRDMNQFVLPTALDACETILLAGAGGGYDVYAALSTELRARTTIPY